MIYLAAIYAATIAAALWYARRQRNIGWLEGYEASEAMKQPRSKNGRFRTRKEDLPNHDLTFHETPKS